MCPSVALEFVHTCKRLCAHLTAEWLLPRVGTLVDEQRVATGKLLDAHAAAERLFKCVRPVVYLQLVLA